MAEPLSERLDRIVSDIDEVTELYDFAEKLYPYENIREGSATVILLKKSLLINIYR